MRWKLWPNGKGKLGKAAIAALLLSPVPFCVAENPYAITNLYTHYPPRENAPIGVSVQQTYRGTNRVFEILRIDKDADGDFDSTNQMFYASGAIVLSISEGDDGKGVSFTSKDNVCASLQDTDGDGTTDTVLLITDDAQLLDIYQLNQDGLYAPISGKEYSKAVETSEAVAPFMTGVLDAVSNDIGADGPGSSEDSDE